ncbi:CAAX prenyl protease 2 [Trypanosoma theileri]|uniref:intramembrane prenyl-peptidase Rce1 n=1 Tax=Trypanosoma theileri TaxID=67003 RepID=A0A1X0NYX6_9TRYP|nr:CAAX prenyl protease 2 [Trypanosoma theileri]ORC89673.1 CAAX prenyl protease 2 [Trypanosoma theileri]
MSDIAFCAALTCGFVGSFYLWPTERRFAFLCLKDLKKASEYGPHFLDRNDSNVVRRRLVSLIIWICLNVLLLEYIWRQNEGNNNNKSVLWGSVFLHHFLYSEGTFLESIKVVLGSCLATLTLFSGVIYENGGISWDYITWEDPILNVRSIICPIGEELLFRATFLKLLQYRSLSLSIILSSVMFSFAHAHFLFNFVTDEYRTAISMGETEISIQTCWWRAVKKLRVLFLCAFACGLLCGYYFTSVCRNNILAIYLSHFLCNIIGPPELNFLRENSKTKRLRGIIAYGSGIIGWITIVSLMGNW